MADKERTREERALHKGIPEYCLGKLTLKGWLSPIKQLFYPPLGNLKCLMRTQTTAAVIVSDQQVFFQFTTISLLLHYNSHDENGILNLIPLEPWVRAPASKELQHPKDRLLATN